jgi:hypothetical protein
MSVLRFTGAHARAARFLIARTSLGRSPVVSLASVDDYDYAVAIHPSIDPSSGELVLLQALSSLSSEDVDWPSPRRQMGLDSQSRHDLWVTEAVALGLMALPETLAQVPS